MSRHGRIAPTFRAGPVSQAEGAGRAVEPFVGDVWAKLNPVTVNAAVSKLVVGRRGATLVTFNEHSHLEAASDCLITYR